MRKVGFVDDESINYADYAKRLARRDVCLLFYDGDNTAACIVDWIIQEELLCILIDFDLRKKFTRNGTDLIFEINQALPDFPCIILTNYPEDSKGEHLVPQRLIWDRAMMNAPDLSRVVSAIDNEISVYLKRKEVLYTQYSELMDKRMNTTLSASEEERFFHLHSIFSRYGETDDVPVQLLAPDTNKKLDSLIEHLSQLLDKKD